VLDHDDPPAVAASVAEAEAAAGGALDILVNNPGFSIRGPVEATGDGDVAAIFETNVHRPLRLIRAVLPAMRERGSGVIVNVSSIAGLVARPYGGIYSATKHALEAISESLHHELKPFGIRVAIVEPGQFETELVAEARAVAGFDETSPYWDSSQRFDAALRRLMPDGKPMPAEVVADTIVAVAFDEGAGLRHLVGPDAELIMSIRGAGSFEHYDKTIRAALDWD
jgi:NAD(P)-dependent dehydrogenase (short-subunit alcohol dehydrogenase family)